MPFEPEHIKETTTTLMKQFILLSVLLIITPKALVAQNQVYRLASPNNRILVTVNTGDQVTYSVNVNNREILAPSPLSMTLNDGTVLGSNVRRAKEIRMAENKIHRPIFENASEIREEYNELALDIAGNYSLIFRAYNNGVAYRFTTSMRRRIVVQDEQIAYNFPGGSPRGYFIEVPGFENSYEDNYKYKRTSELSQDSLAILPALIEGANNLKLLITEADLLDYPGYYLVASPNGLKGALPKYPKNTKLGGNKNFNLLVTERENFLAATEGTRTFPWRLLIIASQEKDLLDNHLVYLLSTPNRLKDVSWIEPGKVAWDWWNALNLSGVNFKTGFNTETYKYFIDFASKNNIEYVNLDEGWSDQHDLLKVTTELDMPEVIKYAKEKNVKLILWCVWHVLDRQMQEALDQFQKWGIAGVKVDFMDRDDQVAVNFYEKLATEAAKRKLIINYHGAYKPTGLRRTYPNVINREAVMGLEYNKWSDKVTPAHNVTIPFIRMAVGPMDYTPGAMRNAAVPNFRAVFEQPMSQGTRCHQLAMFVIYHAPLQMLADAPTAYEKEPDVLHFLSQVPTVWDETYVIDGKVGQYAVMARRKGNIWYVGAMGNNENRQLTIPLNFLGDGNFNAEIFLDGINADRHGTDYVKETKTFNKNSKETIQLAPGGGWAAVLSPVD